MYKINKKASFSAIVAIMILCFMILAPGSTRANAANATLAPITAIDIPGLNKEVKGNIEIVGWALNKSGVEKVNILLNGNYVGETTLKLSRPDVLNAYPQYGQGDKVGFSYILDTTKLTAGTYKISAVAIGKDGINHIEDRNVTLISNKWNPVTAIDNPGLNYYTGADNLLVSGWGINASGIKNIKIYLDDKFITDVKPTVSRPDVQKAYQSYNLPEVLGYEYNLNLAGISNGKRKLVVEVEGNDGTKHKDTRYFTINRWSARMAIDNPGLNVSTNNNTMVVSGWGINPSGVKTINIYIDNNLVTSMAPNINRQDVKNAFPEYNIPLKSGYSYNMSLNNLAEGKRKITVEVIGNNGSKTSEDRYFNFVKWNPVTVIDEPAVNYSMEYDSLLVRGWAINQSGVKTIKVYVDNNYVAEIAPNVDRPDVKAAFASYNLPVKNGYAYRIPFDKLSAGTRKITTEAHGNDGSVKQESRNVTITNLSSRSNVETPVVNATFNNTNITIKGWALQKTKVKTANIYLNGTLVGSTEVNIKREDVNAAYPQYKDPSSGFQYTIAANTIKPGKYALNIEFIGTDGTKEISTRNITLNKHNPVMNIESPTDDMTIVDSKLNIVGWGINASGVKSVQVSVDGKPIGNTNTGISRPDVKAAFPNYVNSGTSGYSYSLSLNDLSLGAHKITVKVIGNDGTEQTQARTFHVNGRVYYTTYNQTLDYYANREVTEGSPVVYYNGSNQRAATKDEVKYYMNPDNFTSNSTFRLMFMKLTYFDGITASYLNVALTNKGVLANKGNVFLQAGAENNVNPIYLVSHSLLETGNGTSQLAQGVLVKSVNGLPVTPRITYNLYGIGARDGDAVRLGSEYAYQQGWFDIDTAIKGGASWIAKGYITNSNYNQNTLYKMRYNLNDNNYWHQYSTDIAWAFKQTSRMKSLIDQMGNPALIYEFPVFK